ncbi:hypothetical protein [Paenibacillus massiliensis]|uniref:hypothetical protein n=1 Tax=Paenibacillus massiliensis TaxID=225917 RepID=UPI00048F014B|nr:hypothetical protein [Paenibacillus massiliensis]
MTKSLLSEIRQIEKLEQVLKEGWDMSNPCNNHFLKLAQEKKEMKRMRQALQQIINVTKGSPAYTTGAKAHYNSLLPYPISL